MRSQVDCHRVEVRCVWTVQPEQPDSTRVVHLGHPGLSPAALKAVLVFMYTERLDVGIEEVEPVLRVLRKCRLKRMVACVMKERRTLRYYFKSTRKDEAGPRRSAMAPLLYLMRNGLISVTVK